MEDKTPRTIEISETETDHALLSQSKDILQFAISVSDPAYNTV
jgi:hypothetical protein